jgi:hypothetical protein
MDQHLVDHHLEEQRRGQADQLKEEGGDASQGGIIRPPVQSIRHSFPPALATRVPGQPAVRLTYPVYYRKNSKNSTCFMPARRR